MGIASEEDEDKESDAEDAVERILRYKSPCGLASSWRSVLRISLPASFNGAKSSAQNDERSTAPFGADAR